MSVWSEDAEREIRSMDKESDEYKVFVRAKDDVDLTTGYSGPLSLDEQYRQYQTKYFTGRVPDLSGDFVCVFQSLPYDIAGMTIVHGDNRFPDVKNGIRINKSLEMLRSEAQVALLHEMIHASGIKGHGTDFKTEIIRLLSEGAYVNLKTADGYDGIL